MTPTHGFTVIYCKAVARLSYLIIVVAPRRRPRAPPDAFARGGDGLPDAAARVEVLRVDVQRGGLRGLLGPPGVITLTQPKVPKAKARGSQKGFQCVFVSPERVPGVRKGVPRGPVGPPGPPELAALASA